MPGAPGPAVTAPHKAFPQAIRAMATEALLDAAERDRIRAKSAIFSPPDATLADGRRELVGMTRGELAAELVAIGEKPFRAKQLWHWIYHQGATDFAVMNSIARPLQQKLAENSSSAAPG